MKVEDRPHARLGPSSFERAERCTQSVRLSQHAPPRIAGPDALAGEAAHALLERALTDGLDTFELAGIESVEVNGHEVQVDDGMLDAVEVAVRWVRENLGDRPLHIEKRVELAFAAKVIGEPMFGWCDVATQDAPWIVMDYKHGFNVVAADSTQLVLYLLGLVLEHTGDSLDGVGDGYAGSTVIIQPNARAEPVRSHDWTWADLRGVRDRVVTTLRTIRAGRWKYEFGDWCRWCPAAGLCPHLAAVARDPALTAIAPTPEMIATGEVSREQLEEWLDAIPMLDHWIKTVSSVAEDYLVHGGRLSNAKLVRKRTNRRWAKPEAAVAETLREIGIEPYEQVLLSPAKAEKALPKDKRPAVDPLTEKPVGALTLAPADDPREGVEVGATLQAALKASVAAGYLAASGETQSEKGERP